MRHALDTGLKKTVYNKELINKICFYIECGFKSSEIAKIINVDKKIYKNIIILINDIKNKKSWTHISKNYDFSNASLSKSDFSNEEIHQICICLQKNMNINNILDIIGLEKNSKNKNFIYDIRSRKICKKISKDYKW